MNYLQNFISFNESISKDDIEIKVGLDYEEFRTVCDLCSKELAISLGTVPPIAIYRDLLFRSSKYSIAAFDKNSGEIIGGVVCSVRNIKSVLEQFKTTPVEKYIDIDEYDGKKGIEGTALSVRGDYRNGNAVYKLLTTLINNFKDSEFDYIFIGQYEAFKKNIDYKKKGCKKAFRINGHTPVDFFIRDLK